MPDVLGEAIMDYHHHLAGNKLWIHNTYGRKEEMPVDVYFRGVDEMPGMEKLALQLCKGKVLDVGCGAGSHSLVLQQMGFDITALDISAKAVEVARSRGVHKVIQADVFQYQSTKFDTLLLLMNGIGLAGTLEGLQHFLQHAKKLITKNGQLIFDSSDIAYLYKGKKKPAGNYYGELTYQYEYKKAKTEPFKWLYVDAETMSSIAQKEGWKTEVLTQDDYDQYLARLTLK